MPYVTPSGLPTAPIWCVLEKPFDSDKALLCTGGIGFAFQKMFKEAGISSSDVYFIARRPDTENVHAASSIDNLAAPYKPPLFLLVGEAGSFFIPELRKLEGQDSYKTQLNKYVGSLLSSQSFSWPHYAVPLKDPIVLMGNWAERNVTTYVDLGKVKDELEYWKANKTLKPPRTRKLLFHEMDNSELLKELDSLRAAPHVSVDIETLYTKKDSPYYYEYPGSILVIGIASSAEYAISFNPFRDTPGATVEVWRAVQRIFSECSTIIGQNFFGFDSYYLNMFGWKLDKAKFSDTLIRQHILWVELPRKLQFLTRQYTRQEFYKDEMQRTSLKKMDALRHYNCLDAAVTYEVWEAQQKEFDQRPHLK